MAGPARARPPPQPARRPGRRDRLAHPHGRHRAALVGVPDRPEHPRSAVTGWPRRVSIAYPSATSCCSPPRSGWPSTGARARPRSTCSPAASSACSRPTRSTTACCSSAATTSQVILDVGWIFYYLLWGAAALHPSMRTLEQPAEGRTRLTPLRLVFLSVACLIAPGIRFYQEWGNTDVIVVIVRLDGDVPARARPHGRARAPGGAGGLAPARPAPRRASRSSAPRASIRSRPPPPARCASSPAPTPTRALVSLHEDPAEDVGSRRPRGAWLTELAASRTASTVRWIDVPRELRRRARAAARCRLRAARRSPAARDGSASS